MWRNVLNNLFRVEDLTFTEVRLKLAKFFRDDTVLRISYRNQLKDILFDSGMSHSDALKTSEKIINFFTKEK